MWLGIGAMLIYVALAYTAFSILIEDTKLLKKSLRSEVGITNGDVVFCAVMAAIPLVGFIVAVGVKFTASYGPSVNNWASRESTRFNAER